MEVNIKITKSHVLLTCKLLKKKKKKASRQDNYKVPWSIDAL